MKYWRIYTSAEKEVGSVPQIVDPVFNGYYTDSNQLWNNYLKKIDKNTIIPKGNLQNRAKLTDLMSVSFATGNLFISDKLRNIFEHYSSEGVQFADTQVITKNGHKIKVNIMHPFFTDHPYLDIIRCEFQISNAMGNDVCEIIRYNSFAEFRAKREELINESKKYEDINNHKWVSLSKVVFKENSNVGICSVFDVTYAGVGFFVSQELKDQILNENCSGIIFREVNEKYP